MRGRRCGVRGDVGRERVGRRAVGVRADARQARGDCVEAVLRGVDHPVDCTLRIGPDRRDQKQLVGEAVEDEDHRRAHEDHVGKAQPRARRAWDALDKADRFIGEEADERRERLGQSLGHVEAAFGDEVAQRLKCGGFQWLESFAVAAPVAVDPRGVAGDLEHQVGVEPEQAVAPACFAALDRFEHPVAAPRLDQLERRRNRRFDVGDQPLPNDRAAPPGQRFERCGSPLEAHPYSATGAVPVSSARSWFTRSLLIVTPTRRLASAASCSISSLPKAGASGCAIAATRAGSIDFGSGR